MDPSVKDADPHLYAASNTYTEELLSGIGLLERTTSSNHSTPRDTPILPAKDLRYKAISNIRETLNFSPIKRTITLERKESPRKYRSGLNYSPTHIHDKENQEPVNDIKTTGACSEALPVSPNAKLNVKDKVSRSSPDQRQLFKSQSLTDINRLDSEVISEPNTCEGPVKVPTVEKDAVKRQLFLQVKKSASDLAIHEEEGEMFTRGSTLPGRRGVGPVLFNKNRSPDRDSVSSYRSNSLSPQRPLNKVISSSYSNLSRSPERAKNSAPAGPSHKPLDLPCDSQYTWRESNGVSEQTPVKSDAQKTFLAGRSDLQESPGMKAARESLEKCQSDVHHDFTELNYDRVTSYDIKEMESLRTKLQEMMQAAEDTQDVKSRMQSILQAKDKVIERDANSSFEEAALKALTGPKSHSKSELQAALDKYIKSNKLGSSGNSGVISSESALQLENGMIKEHLERERYRRQHCEKEIHTLNGKLLETQEQLAIAVSTEKKKDLMIDQLDKTLNRVVDGWKKREAEKEEYIKQLRQDKENIEKKCIQQNEQDFERQRILDLLTSEKEKSKQMEKKKKKKQKAASATLR